MREQVSSTTRTSSRMVASRLTFAFFSHVRHSKSGKDEREVKGGIEGEEEKNVMKIVHMKRLKKVGGSPVKNRPSREICEMGDCKTDEKRRVMSKDKEA